MKGERCLRCVREGAQTHLTHQGMVAVKKGEEKNKQSTKKRRCPARGEGEKNKQMDASPYARSKDKQTKKKNTIKKRNQERGRKKGRCNSNQKGIFFHYQAFFFLSFTLAHSFFPPFTLASSHLPSFLKAKKKI